MLRSLLRAIGIGALALAAIQPLGATPSFARPAAHVAYALKTYTSSAYGYSISYPGTWAIQQAKGIDFAVLAPGQHAGFIAIVKKQHASAAQLKADLKSLVLSTGTPQNTPAYSVQTINGISYAGWQANVKSSSTVSTTVAFGTTHGKYTYYFLAGVDLNLPSTKTNSHDVGTTIGSLKLQ